jgi:hypothetical protein
VQDEASLVALSEKLTSKNIKHELFREPDVDNQLTAISIEPSDAARRACSNIPLAMKNMPGLNKNNFNNEQVRTA